MTTWQNHSNGRESSKTLLIQVIILDADNHRKKQLNPKRGVKQHSIRFKQTLNLHNPTPSCRLGVTHLYNSNTGHDHRLPALPPVAIASISQCPQTAKPKPIQTNMETPMMIRTRRHYTVRRNIYCNLIDEPAWWWTMREVRTLPNSPSIWPSFFFAAMCTVQPTHFKHCSHSPFLVGHPCARCSAAATR